LLAAVVALAIAVAGCGLSGSGQVRVADPLWPGEILFQLNADAEGKQVVVKMLSGEELQGVRLHASSDSTVWYTPDDPGSRTAVRTSQIAMLHVSGSRQATRVKEGFAVGAALGVLPTLIGVADQPETAGLGVFTGLLCGGAGGALGALIGRGIKHEVEDTVTYVLNGPPPSTPGRW
jgi:hypothetical protein